VVEVKSVDRYTKRKQYRERLLEEQEKAKSKPAPKKRGRKPKAVKETPPSKEEVSKTQEE
jgi:hypothetical protein